MAQRRFFRLSDLSGGLNLDANPVLIADNQAVEILNFRLDKHGSLLSRQGYTRVSTTSPGTITTLGRWYDETDPAQNVVLVHTEGGELVGLVSGEWTTFMTGLEPDAGEFRGVRDLAVFANGNMRPVAFDGTSAYHLGVTAPAAPNLSATTGTLTGTFRYALTYYDSATGSESNPSPTSPITLSAQGTSVTITASSEARVDTVRIYRTNAGGSTLLLLDEVANSSGTYHDDGSETLTTLTVASDNGLPGDFEHVAYYKGYVFGSIGKRIHWSKVFRPDSWPALNVTEVPFEGNDTITALWSYEDTLVIFGRRNTVILVGSSEDDFQLSRIDVDIGCVGRHGVCEVNGQLVFMSFDGLRSLPGVQPFVPQLDRTLATLGLAVLSRASLAYVPEEHAIWLAVGGKIYCVHLDASAVTVYSISTPQLLSGGASGFDLPLFIDVGETLVNRYGGVPTDVGAAIPLRWKSKIFQMDNPELTKHVRRIGAFASTGSSSIVTITIADRNASASVPLISTDAGNQALWDAFDWDEDVWASEGATYFIASLPAQTLIGHTMQVTISGEATDETEVVSPITIEYRESGRFLGV